MSTNKSIPKLVQIQKIKYHKGIEYKILLSMTLALEVICGKNIKVQYLTKF